MIHVCSLARLHDTVRDTGARHVVTLIKDVSLVHRPATIIAENHLLLDMDDINDPIEGYVAPAEEHVGDLLRFVRAWAARGAAGGTLLRRHQPFHRRCVRHCLRAQSQARRGADRARAAGRLATAMPNLRIISHADRLLGRNGRMVAAIEAIGPGEPTRANRSGSIWMAVRSPKYSRRVQIFEPKPH